MKEDYIARGFQKIHDDLTFLMNCFREVLEELGEHYLARNLPWINQVNVDAAPNPRLCQAYSIAFQLLNMVEENVAAQVRRCRESEIGLSGEPGLWADQLRKMRNAGIAEAQIAQQLNKIWIEPVLTAHPTEAKRLAVLEQHRALHSLIVGRENQMWTPLEQEAIRDEIKVTLERLWRTGEVHRTKPIIAEERRNVLYYLQEVFPSVLKDLDLRLRQAWTEAGYHPDTLISPATLPRLRFATWVGGDRDGHPLVTAEVTGETFRDLRRAALQLLLKAVDTISRHLTMTRYEQKPSEELTETIANLCSEVGGENILQMRPDEPWRQFALLIHKKLTNTLDHQGYTSPFELRDDLSLLARSLDAIGAFRITRTEILPVIRLVDVFGFHGAVLDIRQNSAFHDRAMVQILERAALPEAKTFADWSQEQRLPFLETELLSRRPFLAPGTPIGPEADAVLSCFRANAETNLASAERSLMEKYATLCPPEERVTAVFRRILEEFDLAQSMLREVLGSDAATRRPRFTKTHQIRADALLALHTQQVTLLRDWRAALASEDNESAERLLVDLLVCINAIASGLRTTG